MKWYPLAEIRLTGKLTDTHCFLLCSPFIIFILRACVSRATRMMDLDLQDHKWDILKKEVEDAIYETRNGIGVDLRHRLCAHIR